MTNWLQGNRRCLETALGDVRALLERACRFETAPTSTDSLERAEPPVSGSTPTLSPPSALDTVCAAFGLADFERHVLLLCAGIELDPAIAAYCAALNGDAGRPWATFALSLRLFPNGFSHVTTPWAPLRRWKLVDVGPGPALTLSPLRIDERILHYLTGVNELDERLDGLCEAVAPSPELPVSHADLVRQAASTWGGTTGQEAWPVIHWSGSDRDTRRSLAASVCAQLNLNLQAMSVHALPTTPEDLANLRRLWEREGILGHRALLLEADDADLITPERARGVGWLIGRLRGGVQLSGARLWPTTERALVTFDVARPGAREQLALWKHHLGSASEELNGHLEQLVGQFDLSAGAIRSACCRAVSHRHEGVGARGHSASVDPEVLRVALSARCRAQTRLALEDLALRIDAVANWDDLILPPAQRATLHEMAMHVRQQRTVYDTWGFASRGTRGLGVTGLFAGPSGTGKTMAAEVLARALGLDLYRVDLSAALSKYIGETEKNLRRIFDAAEGGGVVLLFDEADALFGRRSEVKDSHDRYANIEVSYLLQRLEAYRGLAILTTNMKESVDTAFLRRIRFVVQFPFPDAEQRAEIWRRAFPDATPVERLDTARLAQMHVTGGNIRNIALNSAFAAAEDGGPVRMSHLLQAARSEYAKLEKPLTDSETRGWVP